jgi:hypothetical protein
MKALLLLLAAPLAAAGVGHAWCGSVAPGKGLMHVQRGESDVMCGFIQAQHDGAHRFTASVPGTRVWIGRQEVRGSVQLKADQIYSVFIEAPVSEEFVLSWDQPAGVPLPIPPTVLYQPTATVEAPCARP